MEATIAVAIRGSVLLVNQGFAYRERIDAEGAVRTSINSLCAGRASHALHCPEMTAVLGPTKRRRKVARRILLRTRAKTYGKHD